MICSALHVFLAHEYKDTMVYFASGEANIWECVLRLRVITRECS
jgi:hypothetical protein